MLDLDKELPPSPSLKSPGNENDLPNLSIVNDFDEITEDCAAPRKSNDLITVVTIDSSDVVQSRSTRVYPIRTRILATAAGLATIALVLLLIVITFVEIF